MIYCADKLWTLKCLWTQIASLIPEDGKLAGGHSDKFTERNFYTP